MPYDSIHNPSSFRQRATHQKNFNELYQDKYWVSGVSSWGRKELFAARVICPVPFRKITPLLDYYPNIGTQLPQPFIQFINGPPDINDLDQKWDPELVRGTNPECLGLVWAALAGFIRRERLVRTPVGAPPSTSGSSRPTRSAAEVSRAKTEEMQGQIRAFRASRASSASSSSSGSPLGFVSLGDARPPLIWRDDNPGYNFIGGGMRRIVSAADDGGIQMWDPIRRVFRQIVLLEAKRTLEVENGKPIVTEEVLAQMVGQALALHRSNNPLYVSASPNVSITMLASTYFIKFYAFEFPQSYAQSYEGLAMTAHDCHLRADSTLWLDIRQKASREKIVEHLSAIMAWGNSI